MNDQVTNALATVTSLKPEDVAQSELLEYAQVLAGEVARLQDWHAAIMFKMQQGPTQILVPPKELLRTMKRKDVYQQGAQLGYQEAGELAAMAVAGEPAPEWAQRRDDWVDPDDLDNDEDDES